jgi:hypothetical protein
MTVGFYQTDSSGEDSSYTTPKIVGRTNMVTRPAGPITKHDCASKDHQQSAQRKYEGKKTYSQE